MTSCVRGGHQGHYRGRRIPREEVGQACHELKECDDLPRLADHRHGHRVELCRWGVHSLRPKVVLRKLDVSPDRRLHTRRQRREPHEAGHEKVVEP